MIRAGYAIAIAMAALAVSGCATPQVAVVKKVSDRYLACNELKREYGEAYFLERRARMGWSVNERNIAATLLFPPALIGTYINTEKAINAAVDRQRRLEWLAEDKGCKPLGGES